MRAAPPTQLQLATGATAYVHRPFDEVTERIAKHRAKGHPKVVLDGRWFELDRIVAVHPPTSTATTQR